MITVATYKAELAEQLATIKAFIRRGVPVRITPLHTRQGRPSPGRQAPILRLPRRLLHQRRR